jgi:hypothetical protein
LALFVISFAFLAFFKPFGLDGFPTVLRYKLLLKYTSYPIVCWLGLLALSDVFFKSPYTTLRSLVMLFFLTIVAGLTSYVVFTNYFGYLGFNCHIFKKLQLMAFATGFIPLLIILVFHSNYSLQKQLKELANLNQNIDELNTADKKL